MSYQKMLSVSSTRVNRRAVGTKAHQLFIMEAKDRARVGLNLPTTMKEGKMKS